LLDEVTTLTAIHEAGHAVAACALGHAIVRVSLDDGCTTRWRDHPRAHIVEAAIAVAGPTAERRYRAPSPAELEVLWREQWGTDLANARKHIAACDADPLVLVLEVELLVREHWTAIERVAAALEECSTLTGAEIDALMHPMSAAGQS
jgi:hypothetical protein